MSYTTSKPSPFRGCIVLITVIASLVTIAVGYFQIADYLGWNSPNIAKWFVLPRIGSSQVAQRVLVDPPVKRKASDKQPVETRRFSVAYSGYSTTSNGLLGEIDIAIDNETFRFRGHIKEALETDEGWSVPAFYNAGQFEPVVGGYHFNIAPIPISQPSWSQENNSYKFSFALGINYRSYPGFAIKSDGTLILAEGNNAEEVRPHVFEVIDDGSQFAHMKDMTKYRVSFEQAKERHVYSIPPLSGGYGYDIEVPEGDVVIEIFTPWPDVK
jgi:hypothetical protein